MSFIKESKDAYKKVQEAIGKETADHEISMARGECETIADRALAISAMLEGTPEDGNPLPAWVQSKITNACDYITTVHDYLKYNPKLNESVDLNETTLFDIHKMKENGKTSEEIAKELKLNAGFVKRILGEEILLKEFTDAQISLLKKEFDPLKNKQISTARANQLSNILNKLDDGSLEKLKNALIPFVSAVAASKITQRKFRGVKITNVKVPGLEGMAEEKIPQDYLDYLRTIVLKNVDFYEVPPSKIIQAWKDEKNKDRFKGKMVDYKEAVDMSKVKKYKMISIKGDQKIITIDRKDLEKYLLQGYVIHEPITEEIVVDKPAILKSLQDRLKKLESDPDLGGKQDMIAYVKSKIKMLQSKKEEVEESFKDNIVKKIVKPIQDYNKKKEEPKKEEVELEESTPLQTGISMMKTLAAAAGIKPATSNNGYQAIYDYKNGEGAFKGQGKKSYEQVKNWIYKNGYEVQVSYLKQILGEEVELKPVPSLEDSAKKHKVDIEVLKKQLEKGIQVEKEHTKDEKTAEKIALAHIDERPDYYDQLAKVEKQPVKESHFAIGQHVIYHGPKNPITPIKAQIIGMASPQKGAYYLIKKADGETTYAAPEQMKLQEATFDVRLDVDGGVDTKSADSVAKMLKDKGIMAKVEPSERDSKAVTIDTSASKDKVVNVLGNIVDEAANAAQAAAIAIAMKKAGKKPKNEACWTGYKQVGMKKKNGKEVPNCVPEETIKEQKRLYIESIVAVKNKAEKSGMPYSILKQVYDRGMAAWKGGHRPGATQVQWALARVNSFVTKSSGTWGGADSDLAKKVKGD